MIGERKGKDEMNVYESIEKIKSHIVSGKSENKDIDALNEIKAYIVELEEKVKMTPEPALLESFEEMIPGNVVIQNATIYIGCTPPTPDGKWA